MVRAQPDRPRMTPNGTHDNAHNTTPARSRVPPCPISPCPLAAGSRSTMWSTGYTCCSSWSTESTRLDSVDIQRHGMSPDVQCGTTTRWWLSGGGAPRSSVSGRVSGGVDEVAHEFVDAVLVPVVVPHLGDATVADPGQLHELVHERL